MAGLTERTHWENEIYRIEENDPVEGGESGVSNKPIKQLANRTRYLKQEVEKAASTTQAGRVQLDNATNSTATNRAATPQAVKFVKDLTDSKVSKSGNEDVSGEKTFNNRLKAAGGLQVADSRTQLNNNKSARFGANDRDAWWEYGSIGTVRIMANGDFTYNRHVVYHAGNTPRATDTRLGFTQLSHETNGQDRTKAASEYALGEVRRMANQAQVTADGIALTWNNVQSKPATFPPTSHRHNWGEIDGKPATFSPSSHRHNWSEIDGKPATFTPSTHRHNWSEIDGKPTTLAGYGITDFLIRDLGTESLNDIKTAGYYRQDNHQNATTARHYPEHNKRGTLHVYLGANGVLQEYTTFDLLKKYIRKMTGSNSWGAWELMVKLSDATDSTAQDVAASSRAVKEVKDLADGKVGKSGNETINGEKTFSARLIARGTLRVAANASDYSGGHYANLGANGQDAWWEYRGGGTLRIHKGDRLSFNNRDVYHTGNLPRSNRIDSTSETDLATSKAVKTLNDNKADRSHTHRVSEISDFAQGVGNQFSYRKIGDFEIRKFPDGTMIQTYKVGINNQNTGQWNLSFDWAESFRQPPHVIAMLSGSTTEVGYVENTDTYIMYNRSLSTASRCVYHTHEYKWHGTPINAEFTAIGRWK